MQSGWIQTAPLRHLTAPNIDRSFEMLIMDSIRLIDEARMHTSVPPASCHQFCRALLADLGPKNARHNHSYACAFSARPRLKITSAFD